jgi:hypothetical protein
MAEVVVACVVAAILCASVGIWAHGTLTRDYSTGEEPEVFGTLSAQRVHRHRYADGFAAARRHNATREKLARREGFDEGFLVGINDRKESLR